ncbi:MAG TPA: retropepsin-like aspartic protease [Terriglobales bacterium]|nr:retropepsin-like aspartic protease [Terriglobales bacterium]
MTRSRILTVLALAALAVSTGCTSLSLDRSPAPGTVHARVVDGAGGARLLVVPVYISSQGPYDFALDTGAARSIVDSRVASRLRLPTSGTEQTITGVSGTSEAARVRVTSWRVDTVALPDATILSLRLPSGGSPELSGLLGSDMLSRFRTVTIDYQTGAVTLS